MSLEINATLPVYQSTALNRGIFINAFNTLPDKVYKKSEPGHQVAACIAGVVPFGQQ